MKKQISIKEPVRIRTKALKDGNQSLYLDIMSNGSRKYEFLKLYLIPERTKMDKERNAETLRLANSVKSQRIVEIQTGRYGMEHEKSGETSFFAFANNLFSRKNEKKVSKIRIAVYKLLQKYEKRDGITFADIDKKWVEGFCRYIGTLDLEENTKFMYFATLKSIFNAAICDGIINRSPAMGLQPYKMVETHREYLTIDEVRAFVSTPCRNEEIRRMFLFSCLTGLRWSDVCGLTWGDVSDAGNFTRIIFRQKKTGGQEYIDITPEAVELMGDRKKPEQAVFNEYCQTYTNRVLNAWATDAGINKHITFHCARHTFAVMMLDIGTDIYTVSKLLGHRELSTTQIYAKILDKNKQKAVSNIPKIL